MAKRIRVSADSGATWHTLPGASGEMAIEMAEVDDTVFGQEFASAFPSIGTWNINGAAYFKGVAGYTADVKVGGLPTSVLGEGTTALGGNRFQVTAAARRMIDLNSPLVVKDGSTTVAASGIKSVDYLNGVVELTGAPTDVVTLDYSYIPSVILGKARSFNLSQTAAEIDTTDYATAKANGGWREYEPGLKTVTLEIGNVWRAADDFIAKLQGRDLVYVDVSPDNTAGHASKEVVYRGFFRYTTQNQSGNVGALEEETLNLSLSVPVGELIESPFKWYFGNSNALSPAVRNCLLAWQTGTPLMVEYSPNGVAGKKGMALVTECSLANVYEGQNEFSFSFLGTGTLEDI